MNLYSLITRSLHVFTVSRPQLASKHTCLQLAARPGRHPAATDEGREVQSASNRPATDHRFYSHIETSTLKTHTGLECLKKKNWRTTDHMDIQYVSRMFSFTSIYILRCCMNVSPGINSVKRVLWIPLTAPTKCQCWSQKKDEQLVNVHHTARINLCIPPDVYCCYCCTLITFTAR